MKNAMRESLAKTLSHLKTARLKVIRSQMKDWDHVHAMKKNSWFWHENGNASSRRSSEQYYSRNESLQIGKVELHYFSDLEMTRAHVYWKDGLSIVGDDSTHVTFGDI